MSAPWWHCYPLLVLTIYSQWHFRRWVRDIWLMRNRWTSSDVHYTCSFLHCSLPCSLISLFFSAAELFLLLHFKWEGMFLCCRERTNAIPANAVRKCLSCSMYLSLGSLHAVLVHAYLVPSPLQFLDPSWQWAIEATFSHAICFILAVRWFEKNFIEAHSLGLGSLRHCEKVFFLSILGLFSSWGWFLDEVHCRWGAVIRASNLNFPSTLLIPSQYVCRICVRAPVFSSS